ncbi:hypothetical protein MJO29_013816 [Puccinia striiformis f. sp. tritici]|uniref:hypothetical protein n=1 Tax=Puccinia striiformis f. sp. tritici TaxID=168172 RepID=UPI0020077213|nr:hypothetical protein Pst134EA_025527 [Puccinia striiformis f. sp. tritici]KAH9451579.1 hypothetical protein Pst134EA_025527 [Puccinia striiformis f. sp. tritici]KAI7941742.1 hypothetical protein MJO29_013816 [Puccinia striiformis f. sp. tritici]
MSSKGKRNSTASTYSSNKKRRERELSPSSDDQPESVAKASPGEKSNKSSKKTNGSKPPKEANSDDEEEDDDAPDEEVFEVETIKSHRKKGGKLQYYVSWKGYKSDQDTWEPEKNLEEGAADILEQYKAAHKTDLLTKSARASGASGKSASKKSSNAAEVDKPDDDDDNNNIDDDDEQKKRKRKRSSQDKTTTSIASLRKNGTGGPTKADRDSVKNCKAVQSESEASAEGSPTDHEWHERHKKLASWDDLIQNVRNIEKPLIEDDDDKSQDTQETKNDMMRVCLSWKCGKVTWLSNKIARDKLPQRLIDFYEDHLQFTSCGP